MNAASETLSGNADEEKIRDLMTEWSHALCAKDLNRLTAHYAPEIVFFDVVPPEARRGVASYREAWEQCFPYLPPTIGSEMRELHVTVSGDLAFAHAQHRIIDAATHAAATCGWVRVTVCFQKQDGAWKVVHEHVSVPYDPQSGQAVLTRE